MGKKSKRKGDGAQPHGQRSTHGVRRKALQRAGMQERGESRADQVLMRNRSSGIEIPRGTVPAGPPPDAASISSHPGELLDFLAGLARRHAYPDDDLMNFYGVIIASQGKPGFGQARTGPLAGAAEMCAVIARSLTQARAYQVSAQMVPAVTAACHRDRSTRAVYKVGAAELPWHAGFAWLDDPVVFADDQGNSGAGRAVSWGPDGHGGTMIVMWAWHADRDTYWNEDVAAMMLARGGLTLASCSVFPAGAVIVPQDDSLGQVGVIRWTRMLWHALSSEIAVSAPARIDRHARRRALRSLQHGEVNVITLAKLAYPDPDREPGRRDVTWTCRWTVDPFWRHARRDPAAAPHHAAPDSTREHCAECGMRISYIGSFAKPKGRTDLPWKKDRQLYRLSRSA